MNDERRTIPIPRRRRRRRGANAMEFALTLPVFIAVTMGMVEFGWFFSRVALVNSALMDGCREGALIDELEGDPETTATARMEAVLTFGGQACTDCDAEIIGVVPGKTLRCSVEVDYETLTGFFTSMGVMPNTITSETRSRLEWQRVD
jgi:hypothetical protein